MKRIFVLLMICAAAAGCSAPAARTGSEVTDRAADISMETITEREPEETITERGSEETITERESTETITERESEETVTESESTETITESETEETDDDLWLREMEAVDNAIEELMDSEGFDSLSTPKKAEKMLELINNLAVNGSENGGGGYDYPLIDKASVYYDGGDMISFTYACGVLGGVKLEPFDPMFN